MFGFRVAAQSGKRALSWTGSQLRVRRIRWVLYGLAVAFVLFAALGFFVVPPILKGYLERTLARELHRPVTIQAVSFDPFNLNTTIKGVDIKGRDGVSRFVAFDSLDLNFSIWSVPERAPVLNALVLKGLNLNLVRNRDGSYNFSDLLKSGSGKTAGKPLRYSLNNIRVLDSSITFDDRPMDTRHQVTQLHLALPFLSNMLSKVDVYVTPRLTAVVDGRIVDIHGEGRPFSESRVSRVSIRFRDLDLAKYLPYLPADLGFHVISGSLGTNLALIFLEDNAGHTKVILSGDADLQNLAVDQRDGRPLGRFHRVDVSVGALNLLTGQGVVQSVTLHSPELYVRRYKGGALNLAALGGSAEAKPEPKPGTTGPGIDVMLGRIAVQGGTVHIDDQAVRPALAMKLSPFDLTVQGLTTNLSRPATEELSLTTGQGEVLKQSGSVAFSPLRLDGRIEAAGLRPARYAPYDRNFLPFVVEDGKLDFSGHYVFDAAEGKNEVRLSEATAGARGLRLRLAGEKTDFLEADMATVSGLNLDTAATTVDIASLEAAGGHLRAIRSADGNLDLARLAAPGKPGGAPAAQHARSSAGEPAWKVTVDALSLKGFSVKAEDRSLSVPVTLDFPAVKVAAENLSTIPGQRGSMTLQATMEPSGSLRASGPVTLNPPSLAWSVSLKRAALVPFKPYLPNTLAIELTTGTASARGKLSFSLPEGGALDASFAGDASVDDLGTVDKPTLQNFLSWKTLRLDGVRAQATPPSLAVRSVTLSDFFSRLIVSPEGKLNLFQVLNPRPVPPAAPDGTPGTQLRGQSGGGPELAPAKTAPAAATGTALVEIPSITLADGTIDYTDHFIKPNYSAKLTEVVGSLSGLSSRPGTKAELKLSAHLQHQAPILVTGRINPLVKPAYADIKGKVHDVELSPLSPYSGRYAGYIIEKGKLNMDVNYHVEDGHLQAENHLFLDQFTFGSKVDSPDATHLPVKLAVALLKDRQGRIDLDIPVSGSLNDPKFKIGHVILKIIVNILTKAATAPFALLGHLFGGHAQSLSYITFAPGSAVLDSAALQKVSALDTALYEHPGLNLDITGRFDPETDRKGLARAFVQREVKAQKFKKLLKKDEAPASVDAVVVTREEYPEMLFLAYKHKKFPKPRTLGFVKRLPPDEMERLMLTHTTVTDDDLRQLALARAQAVKNALLKAGRVAPQRVFIVAETEASKEARAAGLTRVDFSLK